MTWFVSFLNLQLYNCNKSGARRSSTWPDTPFWPISLKENQQKGCLKGGKSTFKYTCQTPGWFGIIKEVILSCFGMKGGPGWGVVACNVELSAKFWTVFLSPNFMNHLVITFASKKSHFRTSAHPLLVDPLCQSAVLNNDPICATWTASNHRPKNTGQDDAREEELVSLRREKTKRDKAKGFASAAKGNKDANTKEF